MPVVSGTRLIIPNFAPGLLRIPPTVSGQLIDAAAEYVSLVFQIPESGDITHLDFIVGTVGGSGNLSGGLYNLSAGAANLASPYGGMVAGTLAVSSTGSKSLALSTPATAVRGDWVAAVIERSTGSFTMSYAYAGGSGLGTYYAVPQARTFAGASAINIPIFGIRYSGGAYHPIPGCLPLAATLTTTSLGVNTGDELGVYFQAQHAYRFVGCRGLVIPTLSALRDIVLYDDSNNILSSVSAAAAATAVTDGWNETLMPKYTLTAGNWYRLVNKRASAGALAMSYAECVSDASTAQLLGVSSIWQKTSRSSGGSWSNVANHVPFVDILADGIDVASGGGIAFGKMPTSRLVGRI